MRPILTRCHYVCPAIAANRKQAVGEPGTPGDAFNVPSPSFGVSDGDEDLSRFRRKLEFRRRGSWPVRAPGAAAAFRNSEGLVA